MEVWRLLGLALHYQDELDKALEATTKSLEIEPDSAPAIHRFSSDLRLERHPRSPLRTHVHPIGKIGYSLARKSSHARLDYLPNIVPCRLRCRHIERRCRGRLFSHSSGLDLPRLASHRGERYQPCCHSLPKRRRRLELPSPPDDELAPGCIGGCPGSAGSGTRDGSGRRCRRRSLSKDPRLFDGGRDAVDAVESDFV